MEVTKTVEVRKMKEQVLDSMELERERGITIKNDACAYGVAQQRWERLYFESHRHSWAYNFSYEVSLDHFVVEGALLLVDATQRGASSNTYHT